MTLWLQHIIKLKASLVLSTRTNGHLHHYNGCLWKSQWFFFFPWASSRDSCCTLGEVVRSAQAKQTDLESGNTFIGSLWTTPVNFSRGGCFPFSSSISSIPRKSFQSKSKEVRHNLSDVSARNSPFPCWHANFHLTSPDLDKQERLFFSPSHSIALSSQLAPLPVICFA